MLRLFALSEYKLLPLTWHMVAAFEKTSPGRLTACLLLLPLGLKGIIYRSDIHHYFCEIHVKLIPSKNTKPTAVGQYFLSSTKQVST